jgi:Zn-dependent M28 family amino/carboxypeptidase
LGSPNFVRFVYDGDASHTDSLASAGSGAVEDVFVDYFDSQGLASEPTAFDGRSDYDAFISVGIPAGGLFSGADGVKTAEQAASSAAPRALRTTRATTRPATTSATCR